MENPYVFVDNTSPEIEYVGDWEVDTVNSNNTFGGSQNVYRVGGSNSTAYMEFNIVGKGAEVYGTYDSALELKSQMDGSIYTSLDDGKGNPGGRKGVRIFDLGSLSGPRTINIQPLAGQFIVDYLIYSPIGRTEFSGKQLVFDDTNPSLNFSGAWTPRAKFDASALPFNNTLTSTSQKGASFAIDFVGSSVAVYGAFNSTTGPLSATFSIDGSNPSPVQLINQTATTTEWTLHRQFFQHTFSDPNAETPHVLNVTIAEASESQPFILDYILATGNSHTKLLERQFLKTGSEAKSTGLRVGLIVLGIALALFAWFVFSKWRERKRKAKGLAELSKP